MAAVVCEMAAGLLVAAGGVCWWGLAAGLWVTAAPVVWVANEVF